MHLYTASNYKIRIQKKNRSEIQDPNPERPGRKNKTDPDPLKNNPMVPDKARTKALVPPPGGIFVLMQVYHASHLNLPA
jgi:hypothetical protein